MAEGTRLSRPRRAKTIAGMGDTAAVDRATPASSCDADHGTNLSLHIWLARIFTDTLCRSMFLTSLECQVSELVHSDACPRPTTNRVMPCRSRSAPSSSRNWIPGTKRLVLTPYTS
jgi:hypothetical protein